MTNHAYTQDKTHRPQHAQPQPQDGPATPPTHAAGHPTQPPPPAPTSPRNWPAPHAADRTPNPPPPATNTADHQPSPQRKTTSETLTIAAWILASIAIVVVAIIIGTAPQENVDQVFDTADELIERYDSDMRDMIDRLGSR
jgi:hypothetical protein